MVAAVGLYHGIVSRTTLRLLEADDLILYLVAHVLM